MAAYGLKDDCALQGTEVDSDVPACILEKSRLRNEDMHVAVVVAREATTVCRVSTEAASTGPLLRSFLMKKEIRLKATEVKQPQETFSRALLWRSISVTRSNDMSTFPPVHYTARATA